MLHQFHQVLARGRFAAGEMDLQRAAVRQFGEHGEGNAERLRGRTLRFQNREPVAGRGTGCFAIGENVAHDAFSRASVRKPLSARSCSIPITSVRIASRGAAYLAASWSAISP